MATRLILARGLQHKPTQTVLSEKPRLANVAKGKAPVAVDKLPQRVPAATPNKVNEALN
jgi:hypothetical protein